MSSGIGVRFLSTRLVRAAGPGTPGCSNARCFTVVGKAVRAVISSVQGAPRFGSVLPDVRAVRRSRVPADRRRYSRLRRCAPRWPRGLPWPPARAVFVRCVRGRVRRKAATRGVGACAVLRGRRACSAGHGGAHGAWSAADRSHAEVRGSDEAEGAFHGSEPFARAHLVLRVEGRGWQGCTEDLDAVEAGVLCDGPDFAAAGHGRVGDSPTSATRHAIRLI